MPTTLASLRDRVEQYLQDVTNLVWTAAAIDESIRLALGEYDLSMGTTATLLGLDGAPATTLPPEHDVLIIHGAAGYAVEGRAVRRSEAFNLDGKVSKDAQAWGNREISTFRTLLRVEKEKARVKDLRAAADPPFASKGWQVDPWDKHS